MIREIMEKNEMNKILQNKNVMFISGGFYNYDELIKNQLIEMGANVMYFCSAPTKNHTLMRLYQRSMKLRTKYCNSLFMKISKFEYDYVFVLNTARLTDEFVSSISKRYIHAKKILYCWDAIITIPEVKNRLVYFDYVFTFDTGDALKNKNMHLLPLFYSKQYEETEAKYDFSFVGFGHSNRYSFTKKIQEFCDEKGFFSCFKLYLPSILYYLRGKYLLKNFKGAKKKDFIYKSLSDETTSNIMFSSKIVLDYEVGSQDGLTMRTIEALGARKKIITTNKNILKYYFYNSNNILVVDRIRPIITEEFIKLPYKELSQDIYERYHIKNWLKYMFLFDETKEYEFLKIGDC